MAKSLGLNNTVDVTCRECQLAKPAVDFVINRGNVQSKCKQCDISYQTATRAAKRLAALVAVHGSDHPACSCGRDVLEFLSIDHVNDDGSIDRKINGYASTMKKILSNSADSALQILCHSCNGSKNKTLSIDRVRLLKFVSKSENPTCACCKESNLLLLTVDHVNNDGNKCRKEHKYSGMTIAVARKTNRQLQVLCHNCNMSKGMYGYCPHTVDGGYFKNLPPLPDPHRVPDSDAKAMVVLAQSGESLRSIAKMTGFPHVTVIRVLKKALGEDATSAIQSAHRIDICMSDADRDRAVELFIGGKSLSTISKEIGYNTDSIKLTLYKRLPKTMVDEACKNRYAGANYGRA